MSGGRLDRILDGIPGYAGYRDMERRRESDHLVRERLANDYGQLADRLGRLANRYADERDLAAVREINKPHTRLVTFRDRLRSATYGYAPLFGNTTVDATALDQIAEFDRSLAEGIEPLETRIAAVEDASIGTEEFDLATSELAAFVESLHDRFAERGSIIESGKAAEPQRVAELLGVGDAAPTMDRRPTAYNLHDGEALTFAGQDYTVIGRITMETPSGSWRVFQLKGGSDSSWLRVPATATQEFQWLQKIDPTGETGAERLQLGDTSFELELDEEGTSEVIGSQGSSSAAPVRYLLYRPFSGSETAQVLDWGADNLTLRGATIDPFELQLWSREGRDAV